MRALVQRVSGASLVVEQTEISRIGQGFLVLLGVERGDTEADLNYLVKRVVGLRIFNDENGRFNRSLADVDGEMLVVSQFTLLADTRHGKRPSFLDAEDPTEANELYELFCERAQASMGRAVKRGVFGAHMEITLTNDGPVTIWLDSRQH